MAEYIPDTSDPEPQAQPGVKEGYGRKPLGLNMED